MTKKIEIQMINGEKREFTVRTSVSIGEYSAGVQAVAASVVSAKNGYQPYIEADSIAMLVFRTYVVGYENITATQVHELISNLDIVEIFRGFPEIFRFIRDCERMIIHLANRSPFDGLMMMAKDALVNMGKQSPELIADIASGLKEMASAMKPEAK